MNKYIAKEFTLDAYQQLLQLATSHFPIKNYQTFHNQNQFLIMRHDVDFSPEHALAMAEIEKRCGVQSTYFIHFHNEFYNAFDFESLEYMQKILALGHQIGLHFDANYYQIQTETDLIKWLGFEKNILENLLNVPVEVFSFHNPDKLTQGFEAERYAGMVNTYSTYFKTEVSYCSDSNGFWAYRKLADVLQDKDISRLQVLLHPGWWTTAEMAPREKVYHMTAARMDKTMTEYDNLLKRHGRLNIDKQS